MVTVGHCMLLFMGSPSRMVSGMPFLLVGSFLERPCLVQKWIFFFPLLSGRKEEEGGGGVLLWRW